MANIRLSLPFLLLFVAFADSSELVSREVFDLNGDVAWVVQVSDLHISAYDKERGDGLVRLLAPALKVIRPMLLLVTGDLTDSKNSRRTSTRQDEAEWIQYRNTMDLVLTKSSMDKRRVFDIRGNHDKYGVPSVRSNLDFFSYYSISSQLNRCNTIQSISLMGRNWKYLIIGIDDSMSVGIRGPTNLFGHPSDNQLNALEVELQHSNFLHPQLQTCKLVFGHFPISFTTSSESGKTYESIFAKQDVSAYICGHLHAKFSKQLWRKHTVKVASNDPNHGKKQEKQFWEWELGDWKESKLIRVLAFDEGVISFLDIELNKYKAFQTSILITYPTDSTNMNILKVKQKSNLFRNDINALIFSDSTPVVNVTAKVYDSFRSFKTVEEIPLLPSDSKPLYHSKWNAENYRNDPSATRYWLQIFVIDSEGKESMSALRPFSVEGKYASKYPNTLLAHLVIGIRWEGLYSILLRGNIFFLIILLFLPKLLNLFMDKSVSYQKWAASVSISKPIQQKKFIFMVMWFLIEGSRSKALWYSMVLYLFGLITLPWFWGHVTSVDGPICPMYMLGWRVNNNHNFLKGLGNPDIMTITLPFLYFFVTPMFILIYGMCAVRSATCFKSTPRKTTKRLRVLLLWASTVIACIHFKLCFSVMSFYGKAVVALSPIFSWVPPLILAVAIYSTSKA